MLRHGRALALLGLVAAAVAVSAVPGVSAFAAAPRQARVGDFFLRPGTMVVKKWTRVTWKWHGYLNHNVTVKKGPAKFHSRTQSGGSFSHRFTRRGTYFLYCTLHPTQMKEKIVVR
jgi:plastocyanin